MVEHVQQVRNVEADVERIAAVIDREPFLGFLLLVVGADDGERILGEDEAHAADLFVREDRGAVERLRERAALQRDLVAMPRRDHLLVIRELALDDLRDDVDIAEGKAHLVRSDRERYRLVAIAQELDQLDHGLARQDRLDRSVVRPQGARCVRQPMAVGRDDAKRRAVDGEKHPVQVIADVLHRHRELHQAQGVLQGLLRQREHLRRITRLDHPREIRRRESLEVEAALARAHRHAAFLRLDGDLGVLWQGPQDVVELARTHRHRSLRRCRELGLRGDLDFEVGREEFHTRARSRNQHVRQDGKGMPPFHDSRDLRERSEKFVVGCLDLQHLLKSL